MDATETIAEPDALASHELPGLVVRAQNGDRAAFGELLSAHYDFIYRTAYKWCGNREDAEDIAQDVCIKLPRILSGFEGRSAFSSWLYRIVLNTVRDMQRSRGRQKQKLEAVGKEALLVAEPATSDEQDDAELWAAVRTLPPRQRDCVLLVYAEQRTHAEAADILGCGESTVSWHIHEARKALRTLLVSEQND